MGNVKKPTETPMNLLNNEERSQITDVTMHMQITEEMKRNRMKLLFGDPNLRIEDIVQPIGDAEVRQRIFNLKKEKEELTALISNLKDSKSDPKVLEMEKEIKDNKAEFDSIMKDIHSMRREQIGGIERMCENMKSMRDELRGRIEGTELNIKDMEEELKGAQESQRKLKEDLHIAKNENAQRNWADIRNGREPRSLAYMHQN